MDLDPYTLLRLSGKELKAIAEGEVEDQSEPIHRLLAQEEIDRRKEKRARLRQSLRDSEARVAARNNLPEDEK